MALPRAGARLTSITVDLRFAESCGNRRRVQAVQDHIVVIAPRPAAPSVYVGDRPDMQAVSTSGGTWAACLNQTYHRTR